MKMADITEYVYNGKELSVNDSMKEDFHKDGFIIVKKLLCSQELAILEEALQGPGSLTTYAFGNDDGDGRLAKMCLWNHPGNDVTGALARTRKLAHTAEELLGGEVYHYHSKLIMKEARTGGKFVWHQDYGYWYNFACLFPDMLTVFVAMDPCGVENGCLQVLRGSHRAGRIDHGTVGNQVSASERIGVVFVVVMMMMMMMMMIMMMMMMMMVGADLVRVAELEKCLEKVNVQLQAGDALFFHCNLLHTSSANSSDQRRWAFLTAYNTTANSPYAETVYGPYQELIMLSNDAISELGVNQNLEGKDIVMREQNGTLKSYFS
ncbi:ectoine dioxygenase-like [Elysia marginata]|uniref:Ectoine dioxygenase-like n=1 Tax=Elysia marginata TaxID=1093978 RepID=A0AAV4FHI3_9GAST|nr:ectoine dioxygenase-like [Elysia marginata]